MKREPQARFENDITDRERKDVPRFSLLGSLCNKFRIALLLAAAGGCASYRLQNTATAFEPIDEKTILEEIPREIILEAKIKGGYLMVSTRRKIIKKTIKRITEQEFHYEYREANGVVLQLIAAGVAGSIGAYNIFRAQERSEEQGVSNFGDQNNDVGAANSEEDLSPEEQRYLGIGFAGLGAILAGHGTYVALKGIDSKEPVEQRHVDTPIAEDIIVRPIMCVINLRAGDQTFLIDQTDNEGNLYLTLDDLAKSIPRDQLVALLDGKEVFIKTDGAASIVIDLREMVSAEERIAYEAYKKSIDSDKKIETGSRFLEQYPLSFFATEVKNQVDELLKAQRAELETRKECQNLLDQAKNKKGSQPIKTFINQNPDTCIPEIHEAMNIFCDRLWQEADLRPIIKDFERIRQFLITCSVHETALEAEHRIIQGTEDSLCKLARKARGVKNLASAQAKLREFQKRFGSKAACEDEIQTAYYTAKSNQERNAERAQFETLRRRFKRGNVVSFNTRAVFDTEDCFEVFGFGACYQVGYPVRYTGRVTETDEDNFVIKVISVQLLEQSRQSLKGMQLKGEARQALRRQIGQEKGFSFQDIN